MNRLPAGAAASAKRIAAKIRDARDSHGALGATVRTGLIQTVTTGPPVTCGVKVAETTVPGVTVLSSYTPKVGDYVQVLVWGPSWLVLGPVRQSTGPGETLSQGFIEVLDGQTTPVRRVRLGLQPDGKYGLRVWGSNGLLNYDFTT